MDIRKAKNEIKRTFRSYTEKDPLGRYAIPVDKQRPILLIGPPGIGKTAIMRQIADETGCGLVCYTMTHHTRQSAVGLPFINEKNFGGVNYKTTSYTMSEIVASVYTCIEEEGKKEGILFLDEINCVSETLAPVMLQLLQEKTFGTHRLPEGWMIVAAGNPPEYNKSVRDFDMATLDRVKNIDVEADLGVWQEYALECGIHPAVRSYLSSFPDHFYIADISPKGTFFVTARGWEDLSFQLTSFERDGEPVDTEWFLQYIRHDRVAESFSVYYDLYTKLGRDPEALTDTGILDSFSAPQTMALAAVLSSPIVHMAEELKEKEGHMMRLKEYVLSVPDTDVVAMIEKRKENIRIMSSVGTMSLVEEEKEYRVLERIASLYNSWLTAPGTGSFSEAFAKEITSLSAENDGLRRKLLGKISFSYEILEKCSCNESALLFFTMDLVKNDTISALLKDNRIDSYSFWAEKLI